MEHGRKTDANKVIDTAIELDKKSIDDYMDEYAARDRKKKAEALAEEESEPGTEAAVKPPAKKKAPAPAAAPGSSSTCSLHFCCQSSSSNGLLFGLIVVPQKSLSWMRRLRKIVLTS